MRLGSIRVKNPFVQAPMAGVTDSAFRAMARRFHDGLLFTEMISAEALCRGNWRTMKYLEIPEGQRPVGVQLVGHEPETMARAAELAGELDIDFIDINAGCPQLKVVGPGAGGALLKQPDRLAAILGAVKNTVSKPVSVKIRLGWDADESLALGKMLQDCGAEFITVHGRTVMQKYSGNSDREAIRRLVDELEIPVLANGDVKCEVDALELLEKTGAEGVMIGRATRGRPDLPGTAFSLLEHGSYHRMPPEMLASTIIHHAVLEQELFGEAAGIRRMRKHVHWYLRAAGIRCMPGDIYTLDTLEMLKSLLEKYVY